MKTIIPMILLVVVTPLCVFSINMMDKSKEAEFIEIMEKQTEFSGETVDMLWHWKTEHKCSKKFVELYERKIKNLPGWSYGDTRVDR